MVNSTKKFAIFVQKKLPFVIDREGGVCYNLMCIYCCFDLVDFYSVGYTENTDDIDILMFKGE